MVKGRKKMAKGSKTNAEGKMTPQGHCSREIMEQSNEQIKQTETTQQIKIQF